MVKNIIKVINLYLKRPLRVFPPYASVEKAMFFKCFVQMSVQIDSEIIWGGVSWPEGHVLLRGSRLPRSRCGGVGTFQF